MRIGITGYEGFIGKTVKEELEREGDSVILLKRDAGLPENLDWVLHFAAATDVAASVKNPFFTYSNNIESTLRALETAHKSGNAAFLFMSSYVYGEPEYLPVDEKHPLKCANPYMGSKVTGEMICRQLSELLGIPLVIFRGFNIYGDSRISGRLIPDLLESVRNGTRMTLNDPDPRRDYLYIKDFTALIKKLIRQKPVKTGTYNVGYGKSYSNLEVAEMVRFLDGKKWDISVTKKKRESDVSDTAPDTGLIKKVFSWHPAYSLEEGLGELVRIRREERKAAGKS